MPVVQISIIEGRKPEQIREMIREVTSAVSTTLDAPADTIKVLVTEMAPTHYGSGNMTVAEKRASS